MSVAEVDVRELIAWEFDDYSFRSSAQAFDLETLCEKVRRAQLKLARRKAYTRNSPLLEDKTRYVKTLLDRAALRADMQEEYRGLDWRLGVVDLHLLLAFQRRLIFHPAQHTTPVPEKGDWAQLIAFAFGSRRGTEHRVARSRTIQHKVEIDLDSNNPDLQIRQVSDARCSTLPFALHGGSPNFEVAELQGRWFLRDGYHRAYRLLQSGEHCVPAVVIHARTIEELGAAEPWFIDESQLFSEYPPRVTDFLDDEMTIGYKRTALRKLIRIRIEESLEPFTETSELERE